MKNSKYPNNVYPEVIDASEPVNVDNRKQIGSLRIAKITYDHTPVYASENGSSSIGNMIDARVAEIVANGELVSEVSLFFETPEQQHVVREMYSTPRYRHTHTHG